MTAEILREGRIQIIAAEAGSGWAGGAAATLVDLNLALHVGPPVLTSLGVDLPPELDLLQGQ
jgi:hypothetical protein